MPAAGRLGEGTPRISPFTFLISLFTLPALLLTACGDNNNASTNNDKINVITTLPLFADFVRNVGGDRVDVTSLLPLGADPHTFEPSPRDVEPITKADIAFANGLDLEPGLIKVLEANLPDDAELVLLGEESLVESLRRAAPSPTGDAAELLSYFPEDPHLWMASENADDYVQTIWHRLERLDGTSSQAYEIKFFSYLDQIVDASEYLTEKADSVRPENQKLVTSHEAFDWLAYDIGYDAVAAVAEAPGQESSPRKIADVASEIKAYRALAVFSEPQISEESHILEQAAEDAGVQVCTLYADSLDDEVSTYIEMMRFNADELARCLGGD